MDAHRTWELLGKGLLFAIPAIAVLYLLHLVQPVLAPFLVALALAYLGDPLVDRLEARGLGRTTAVILVFAVLLLALLILLLVLIPVLGGQLAYLYERLPVILGWLQQVALPWLETTLDVELRSEWLDLDLTALQEYLPGAGSTVKAVLAQATQSSLAFVGWIANLVLIPVVTFYTLRDWDHLTARIEHLVPRYMAPTVVSLARQGDEVLSGFMRGQLLVMLALGLIYAFGLWAVGLELAFLIGMIAGLASIVPYLGTAVGVIVATIVGFFQFGDWLHLLLIWGVFVVGQMLEGTLLTPYLVGDRIGLHPVLVIFVVLVGGELFGFTGILLALPVAAVLMVLVRYTRDRYLESPLYRGRAADDRNGGA